MSETITATKLARNLSDVLNRVRYQGDRFIVERNGEPIAEIIPATPPTPLTLGQFLQMLDDLGLPDPDFARDLAHIQATQPMAEFIGWEWDS